MSTLLIILAIYVALDIITGVGIYITLRVKGWTPSEMARQFRAVMTKPYEDYVEDIYYEVRDLHDEWNGQHRQHYDSESGGADEGEDNDEGAG